MLIYFMRVIYAYMKAELLAFRIYKKDSASTKNNQALMNRFVQKFYGQDTTNHKGKYRFHRHGFLEDIAHIKLIRGVIILREEDVERVMKFLSEYDAEVHIRDITPTPEDEKNLANKD